MNCSCGHCTDAEDFFGKRTARRDLRRYRRRGPIEPTRLLIAALRSQLDGDETLLDIGGGIGAIQHELLEGPIRTATQVDASAAYLEKSREEAEREGHADRVTYRHGDFVDLAPEVPAADVVTLDRVVCCYPDMETLVRESAAKAKHLYGLGFPRTRLVTRLVMGAGNLFLRARGSAFRTYLHSERAIADALRRAGLERTTHQHTFFWNVETWRRVS